MVPRMAKWACGARRRCGSTQPAYWTVQPTARLRVWKDRASRRGEGGGGGRGVLRSHAAGVLDVPAARSLGFWKVWVERGGEVRGAPRRPPVVVGVRVDRGAQQGIVVGVPAPAGARPAGVDGVDG